MLNKIINLNYMKQLSKLDILDKLDLLDRLYYNDIKISCDEIKHLEMIEKVIERMSVNSFSLKSWTGAIAAAIGTLSTQLTENVISTNPEVFLIAIAPIIVLWFLDFLCLQKDRKFRWLYRKVTERDPEVIPFSMNITKITEEDTSFKARFFSKTELSFYFVCIILVIAIYIFFPFLLCKFCPVSH